MRRLLVLMFYMLCSNQVFCQQKPNVIYIYADDLGYGDLSCYGATKISTPNIDKLSSRGLRFTNAHCTSSTCTPSRYGLMTGRYPWRQPGTGILDGDAALIIPTDRITLPFVFKKAGYHTAIVGKWHLGLGDEKKKNWNAEIKPGPNESGFDYSFIFPATADRVPTIFIENHYAIGLDSTDPIGIDYDKKIGQDPTGKENPELLKMKASPNAGHDETIVNGIGRIGFMEGGAKARWTDEEIAFTFLEKAKHFIEANNKNPFFLYFAASEPHVPRMPATMFKGKSSMGYRGDAILELDWLVGEIIKEVDRAGLAGNTIIIFTSDNGPVLDDGYQDGAVSMLGGHTPSGPMRGGKYSILEGGTRIPFTLTWPGHVNPGLSTALVSQMDLLSSFAKMLDVTLAGNDSLDSQNLLDAFLGHSVTGRTEFVEQGNGFGLVLGEWKYISSNRFPPYSPMFTSEKANAAPGQLYNLKDDIGETKNLAGEHPEKVLEMQSLLKKIMTTKG